MLYTASVWALPVVTAITLHEAAHGWMAWKLGGRTRRGGPDGSRSTPRGTSTPFGTIILPALLLLVRAPFLFGYAKPVPVDFSRLRRPRRDMIWVAAAGPGINLAMAWLAAVLMHSTDLMPEAAGSWALENLRNAVLLNLVLAVFNMFADSPPRREPVVPRPPSRGLAVRFARLDRFGMAIIVGLIVLPSLVGMPFGLNLDVLPSILLPPIRFLLDAVLLPRRTRIAAGEPAAAARPRRNLVVRKERAATSTGTEGSARASGSGRARAATRRRQKMNSRTPFTRIRPDQHAVAKVEGR